MGHGVMGPPSTGRAPHVYHLAKRSALQRYSLRSWGRSALQRYSLRSWGRSAARRNSLRSWEPQHRGLAMRGDQRVDVLHHVVAALDHGADLLRLEQRPEPGVAG